MVEPPERTRVRLLTVLASLAEGGSFEQILEDRFVG